MLHRLEPSEATHYIGWSSISLESKEEGKYQESIQSNTTPDIGHHEKVTKSQKHYIQESQEVSTFPAGAHKDSRNRQDSMTDKHKTQIKQIHKRSTALEQPVKYFTGELNHV